VVRGRAAIGEWSRLALAGTAEQVAAELAHRSSQPAHTSSSSLHRSTTHPNAATRTASSPTPGGSVGVDTSSSAGRIAASIGAELTDRL
jgi:hypothetical protein